MVTQKEIADHLGVSRRLVGFALNGNGTVAQETARKIRMAAEELGYQPNSIARAMVTGKNPVLGFITYAPDNFTVARILRGVLEGVEANDHFVKVLQVREPNVRRLGQQPAFDPSVDQCIDQCLALRVAAVIATSLTPETAARLHERLSAHRIPVALVEVTKYPQWGIHIMSDDEPGAREAVDHLVELGHRRIGILAGPEDSDYSRWRVRVFREALGSHGLSVPDDLIAHAHWGAADADDAARTLFAAAGGAPTAVLCAADDMAMCVLRTARACGLDVPSQLSVIGFGNQQMTRFADPPLSTVEQCYRAMGTRAVESVMERLRPGWETSFDDLSQNLLPTHLVPRESTARARQ